MKCDVTNGINKKRMNVILKRGRTIIKRHSDPRNTLTLKNNLIRTLSCPDTHTKEDIDGVPDDCLNSILSRDFNVIPLSENKLSSSAADAQDSNNIYHSSKAIKLDDKLISGKEVELYPSGVSKSKSTTDRRSSENETFNYDKQAEDDKASLPAVNRSLSFNCTTVRETPLYSNKPGFNSMAPSSSLICEKDYPKLYLPNTLISDKNTAAKKCFLKNIRSIQNSGKDAYSINISNSRFFVPKDYVFSNVECSMDDLKFEVDPEMRKLLQRNIGKLRPIKTDVRNGGNSCASDHGEDATLQSISNKQDKPKGLSLNVHKSPTTSAGNVPYGQESKVTLKGSSTLNSGKDRKERLFYKKSESRPSSGIVDNTLMNNTKCMSKSWPVEPRDPQQKKLFASFENLNSYGNIYDDIKVEQPGRRESLITLDSEKENKAILELSEEMKVHSSVINPPESMTSVTPNRNNSKITNTEGTTAEDVNLVNLKRLSTEKSVEESKKIKSGVPWGPSLERNYSYPPLDTTKSATVSFNCSATTTSGTLEKLSFGNTTTKSIQTSQVPKSVSESNPSVSKKLRNTAGIEDAMKKTQEVRASTSYETNRLKRIKFLETSLETDSSIEDDQRECHLPLTNQASHVNAHVNSNSDSGIKVSENISSDCTATCKDRSLTVGRTSSLREKFETIVEDVELRPGRHPQIGKTCGRKSLKV